MHNKINLSDKQHEIVMHDKGALLVKASAGSGKTRVLTERIKYLLQKTKRKILAITFTNKAGEEMKSRLGDVSEIKNRVFIGTFHSFCSRILQNHGNAIGLSTMPHIIEDEFDRLKLIEKAIETTPSYFTDYKNYDGKKQKEFRYKVLSFISKIKREMISEEQFYDNVEDKDFIMLCQSYREILLSQNIIDFDDLLLLARKLFSERDDIASLYRRSYEYICIDEAQDLNNAQYQFLRSLTNNEHNDVMMVGDPNQSIFAFNGSSADVQCKYKSTILVNNVGRNR